MTLSVDIAWIVATLLVSIRIAAATAIAPVFGPMRIPAQVRVFIAIALSAYLVAGLDVERLAINSLADVAVAALAEAVIGLAFGFGFLVAYAATQIGGRALDVQVGFGAASILNPATESPTPLMGSLFGVIMVAMFLALDGHHVLIQALALSLTSNPPGSGIALDIGMTLQHSAVMFTFGLTLAAPIMFALWLADLAMAVFARSMPQLNVFVLSFAIKIIFGLIGLALSLGITRNILTGLFGTTFRYWERLATPQ